MRWTHRGVLTVGVLAGLVVSGCGGSGSSGATSPESSSPPPDSVSSTPVASIETIEATTTTATTAPTSTTVPETTVADSTAATTTIDPRPINQADQALAQAGELTADAFAAPWTVYAQAASAPVSTDSCSYRPDGAVTFLTNGASQNGPTMELGDTGAFVYSTSLAFPDETSAMEYVAIVNTDAWGTCFAGQLQQFQANSGNDYVVSVATRDNPSLSQGGFESYAQFNITSPEGAIDRIVLVSIYRYGREVIVATEEYGSLSDADNKKMVDDSYAALLAAYNRITALP
jgi:hypothetical protein